MKRFQIYLDPEQVKQLRHLSIDMDTNLSQFIRQILAAYLENSDHEIFRSLHQRNNKEIQ